MQSHSHSSIGISCMDKVSRHIEVFADDAGKDIVRLLVGRVGSPIGQCQHLFLGEVIGQQWGVMSLYR